MNKNMVLVVEDDKAVRNLIALTLDTHDYKHVEAQSGTEAISLSLSYRPDLMILDLGLPDIDGMDVIRKTRTWSAMPIIVVSARSDDRDKIQALDEGADDYLTKPFGIGELLARIRVSLRHSGMNSVQGKKMKEFRVKDLYIDFEKRKVVAAGKNIHLTPTEFKIMELLCRYSGKVLTHNFIINEIWGSVLGSETQSLRVFMANLRRKLEKDPTRPEYIYTEVGVGYRLVEQ